VNVLLEERALLPWSKPSTNRELIVAPLTGRHRGEKPALLRRLKDRPGVFRSVGRRPIQAQVARGILHHQPAIRRLFKADPQQIQDVPNRLGREASARFLRLLPLKQVKPVVDLNASNLQQRRSEKWRGLDVNLRRVAITVYVPHSAQLSSI